MLQVLNSKGGAVPFWKGLVADSADVADNFVAKERVLSTEFGTSREEDLT
jgi:hypothetical protein